MKHITRFAPSPTGNPHVGNIRTALFAYLAAKTTKGEFHLRIEDTDRARYVEGSVEYLHESMKWLRLIQDGEIVYQSDRLSSYQDAAEQLVKNGKAYRCFCTSERLENLRTKQTENKLPPSYDKKCKHLSKEEVDNNISNKIPFVIRLAMPETGSAKWDDLVRGNVKIDYKEMDDFVILKSDGWPTYHLAHIIDDHRLNANCVIRGEEWIPSTPKHLYLYELLGWAPPKFAHLPTILGADNKKLSKRNGDSAILDYKEKGYLPEAMINFLALLGWSSKTEEEIFSLDDLEKIFRIEDINKAPAVFDVERLNWLNGLWIRKLSTTELINRLISFNPKYSNIDKSLFKRVVSIEQTRIKTLAEFDSIAAPYWSLPKYNKDILVFKKSSPEATQKGLEAFLVAFENSDDLEISEYTVDRYNELLTKVVTDSRLNNADVFWPVRVALSGQERSASPAEILWALGPDESLNRLRNAIK